MIELGSHYANRTFYVFFVLIPFSILITLLGEEGAGLCAYRAFAMQTLICVTFSLPPFVGGWLRLLLVAPLGLFCLPLSVFINLFVYIKV